MIADDIKDEIMIHNCMPERYRCVVWVCFGQKNRQGIQVASRCLNNTGTERWTSETFETRQCSVSCHAMLFIWNKFPKDLILKERFGFWFLVFGFFIFFELSVNNLKFFLTLK